MQKSLGGACLARVALLSALAFLTACGSGGTNAATGSGGSSGASTSASSSGTPGADPLHTGLTAANGVSVDAFDAPLVMFSAQYAEPDAMIAKAMIDVESHFNDTSAGCSSPPCGTPSGWTTEEAGCLGLMQVVPACDAPPNGVGLLPNGQPNLATDPTSSGWATSMFNPENNIETGVAGLAHKRTEVEMQFSGCTVDQYTLLAVGNYDDNGSAQSCTVYNTSYVDGVLAIYRQYAAAAGYPAHAY